MTSFFKETFNKTKNMNGDFKIPYKPRKQQPNDLKSLKQEQKLLQLLYTITKLSANL